MLITRLRNDLTQSLKEKSHDKVNAIRTIIAKLTEVEKNSAQSVTEEAEVKVLTKIAKQLQEEIDMFKKADRMSIVDSKIAELEIVNAYLPTLMNESEISQFMDEYVKQNEVDITNTGKLTGIFMSQLKGKAAGSVVKRLTEQKFSGK